MAALSALLLALSALQDGTPPAAEAADKRAADRETRVTPVVRVVQKVAPAVVHIRTDVRMVNPYSPGMPPMPAVSTGSGVIVDPEGYIVTNAHVIQDAKKIDVFLHVEPGAPESAAFDAKLVNADPDHDLALLKIEARPGGDDSFPSVEFGRPDDLMTGETVIAIGNPTGQFADTVTVGVLSATNREITINGRVYKGLLQTDAAINRGNSGGPLLNANGELIGINNAMYLDAQNIGFAIPVAQVRAAIDERLLNVDRSTRFWLGMRVRDDGKGMRVESVDPAGPAARVGIAEGDMLLEVDGKPVAREVDYSKLVLRASAGDTLRLKLRPAKQPGEERTVELRLLDYEDRVFWERLGIAVKPVETSAGPRLEIERIRPRGPADLIKMVPKDQLWGAYVSLRVQYVFATRVENRAVSLESKADLRRVLDELPKNVRERRLQVIVARGDSLFDGVLAVR